MTIRLQDTLSGETRPLVPLTPGRVGVYSCGPTVYGPAHIGNFRSFLFADLLVRHLRWRGLGVTWVMNITDVDDKIIRGSAASGETIETLAERYLAAFLDDAAALRMTTPDVMPRATRYIEQMATLIETLLDGDHAYRTEDGSIFFRISSWPAYGRLARLDPDGQRVGERVESDEYGKDDVRDFALWKGPKPDMSGEPSWETPIGPGRPGWHIECSAMSMAHLGPSFDIHTGGIDLIFPHHEDEIAQSEAATGKQFSRVWSHGAFLLTDGAKMAKRVGNVFTVAGLREAKISAAAIRHFVFNTHYRKELNLSDQALEASTEAVRRVGDFARRLRDPATLELGGTGGLAHVADEAVQRVEEALFDDLNGPEALAALFDFIRQANAELDRKGGDRAAVERAREAFDRIDAVLDIVPEAVAADSELERWIGERLAARREARMRRDFAESDRIRDELKGRGVILEDAGGETRWKLA